MDNNLDLVADIVSAYVEHNSVPMGELPALIASVSQALATLGQPAQEPEVKPEPAVNPKKSVFADYLVSLEDGKHYRTLKRHIAGRGMTPDEYRAKWGLPRDYPMVAASYAAKRSELAKSLGLGRKRQEAAAEDAPADETPAPQAEAAPEQAAKPKRGRKKAEAA